MAAAHVAALEAASSQQPASDDNEAPETGTLISVRSSKRGAAKRPTLLQYVVLISVPILWGTFTPTMKLLLDHKHAPPVLLTNFLSHAVGTAALGLLWLCEALPRRRCFPDDEDTPPRSRMMLASCELGVYLFFGQLTQLLGLGGTSATTNAILVQSSVVIVPLFEALPRQSISPAVVSGDGSGSGGERVGGLGSRTREQWFARCLPSLLALAGIATITIAPKFLGGSNDSSVGSGGRMLAEGSSDGNSAPEVETTFGVLCSLASAACYALHTVRLSEYGDVDATLQATGQVAVNAALDLVSLALVALVSSILGHSNDASPIKWLRHAAHANPPHALRHLFEAACWNGIGVVGATTWAMSYAQRSVRASTAVVAYAMEPLFAAVFAAAFLHEGIGPLLILGGALIIFANVIVGIRMRQGET